MFARLTMMWVEIRDSLWFIPAILTVGAAVVALVLVQIESSHDLPALDWPVGGSVDGARQVLSTIAGSLITVTGVVFSVTIVALQLASSQFTPRLLRNFTADRTNQIVLGVFIATFSYTLLVLRVVRSLEEGNEFVPHFSVALAIVMALVSIGFLIHFIHHAVRSVQPSVILSSVTAEALEQVEKLFPEELGKPEEAPLCDDEMPPGEKATVVATSEGYLLAVDGHSLFTLGEQRLLLIRMTRPVGSFILEGEPLAQIWSDDPPDEHTREEVRRAFVLGKERTPEQDIEFFIIEIMDMAVKALSPSINDPTTAMRCVDRLSQIILAMGKRRPPSPMRTDSGKVHFLALPTTFDAVVELAFRQIIHFGRENPVIVGMLRTAIDRLLELLPSERHKSLLMLRRELDAAI